MQSALFPNSLFTVKTIHKPLLQRASCYGDPSKSRCVIVSKSELRALNELLNHYPFIVDLLLRLYQALRTQMDHHYLKSQPTSSSHVAAVYRLSPNPMYDYSRGASGLHEPPFELTKFVRFTRSVIASRLKTVFENFYRSVGKYRVPHVPENVDERYHFIMAKRYTFELLAYNHNVDGVFFLLEAFPRFYRDSWSPFLLPPNISLRVPGFVTIYCIASVSLSQPILNLCHRYWRGSQEDLYAVFLKAFQFNDETDSDEDCSGDDEPDDATSKPSRSAGRPGNAKFEYDERYPLAAVVHQLLVSKGMLPNIVGKQVPWVPIVGKDGLTKKKRSKIYLGMAFMAVLFVPWTAEDVELGPHSFF